MNVSAVITASCFTVAAVLVLIFLFISKNPLFSGKLRNYFRAGAAVYVSGTILILILAAVLTGVPVAFIVISELTIMTVFVMTFILIIRFSKMMTTVAEKNSGIPEQKADTDE